MTQNTRQFAPIAQGLFLANITLLPIISFVILLFLYWKKRYVVDPVSRLHFRQAILASIVSGILLLIVSGLILFLGGLSSPYTWMVVLIYFVSIHSALILYAVFAFIKALAEEKYVYPLFGRLWC
ncbi:hypothetical protein [Aliikangiella sp. IMCC44359]|uniref:hypothetical protein n=1 Tax=Aliikangiella sp. IMCC44359 TaxID=3459125 RepID=UPI00403ADFDF